MDIGFSMNGDIEVSESGDLRITYDAIENIIQAIVKRIQTRTTDWRIPYPPTCMDITRLGGSSNSRHTGWRLERQVRDAISFDGILPHSMIDVRVFPVNHDTIGAFVDVHALNKAGAAQIRIDVDLPSGTIKVGVKQ